MTSTLDARCAICVCVCVCVCVCECERERERQTDRDRKTDRDSGYDGKVDGSTPRPLCLSLSESKQNLGYLSLVYTSSPLSPAAEPPGYEIIVSLCFLNSQEVYFHGIFS